MGTSRHLRGVLQRHAQKGDNRTYMEESKSPAKTFGFDNSFKEKRSGLTQTQV